MPRTMGSTPGQFLKTVRERLQVGLREVQEASAVIASEEANESFYVSAARLTQIENEVSMPSVFKLFTLCSIYGLDLHDVLSKYGVNANRTHSYETRFLPEATRTLSAEVHGSMEKVTLPVRLDPTFRLETTQLINRVVALWGEIPMAFLLHANPRKHTYGYVGSTDRTMFPLLRPGSLVMIDPERRRIQQNGWKNEFERPIYFVELREGYRCGWCQVDGSRLTLIPHPISSLPVQSFSLASEVDVLGQVVGVAMRLAAPESATSERAAKLPGPREPEK
jgi:transcriptional regulator with XRE-family HTH domain